MNDVKLTFDQQARVDSILAYRDKDQQIKVLYQWVKTGVIQLKTFQVILSRIT